MGDYSAFRIRREGTALHGTVEGLGMEELPAGDVLIRAQWSSVNYKDALAATGAGRIIREFPRVGGIDVAGTVETSSDPRVTPGDEVLVTGYGFGVDHDGGYAELARVPGEWVVPLPDGLTAFQAMVLGTAGLTVAICIQRMEDNGQSPEQGPVAVTGATGGVGSIAVDVLAGLGYEVTALTRKPDQHARLRELGAGQILDPTTLDRGTHPLEKAIWAGAIDNVGGDLLAWLTRTTRPWGNIAAVGLAGGSELHTTVMPFILRGVSLLGITSSGCPTALRHRLWKRLATDLRPQHLDALVTEVVGLGDLPRVFDAMLHGQTHGRTVVEIGARA